MKKVFLVLFVISAIFQVPYAHALQEGDSCVSPNGGQKGQVTACNCANGKPGCFNCISQNLRPKVSGSGYMQLAVASCPSGSSYQTLVGANCPSGYTPTPVSGGSNIASGSGCCTPPPPPVHHNYGSG